jgi:hypothetical protein
MPIQPQIDRLVAIIDESLFSTTEYNPVELLEQRQDCST